MQKVILIILDGYGLRSEESYNAVNAAETPTLDNLFREYPNTTLKCSGSDVGLPDGMMGNSEVGHLNIGAGRIVDQMLVKIDNAIDDKSFFDNDVLTEVMNLVKKRGTALHFMGLMSDGGVHSRLNHIFALLEMAKQKSLRNVFLHLFSDGRDTSPKAGKDYVRRIIEKTEEIGIGKIASISGRYYAMDRDKRWDRIEEVYKTLLHGEGTKYSSPLEVFASAYENDLTDEFILPSTIFESGIPVATLRDGDGIIAFNFRADRMRQLTDALLSTDFREFERPKRHFKYASMTMYDASFNHPFAFDPVNLRAILGEVISNAGLSQLRIAETEKYAHITYFFNGGNESAFKNEDRILINSPKVATYDLKPEMSAEEITANVCDAIEDSTHDFIVLNYANCDMVGHTGSFDAAVKAVETVDVGLKAIVPLMLKKGGACVITADHGNAELMFDENTGFPHTAHTTNPVPLIFAGVDEEAKIRDDGRLADLAPTILELLGLDKPEEMTGSSLIDNNNQSILVENKDAVLDGV